MRKFLCTILTLTAFAAGRTDACTNVIISPGASADGSSMVSYAADSHGLFGELYFRPAARFTAGSRLAIREWDTGKPMGDIAQVERTWQTVGNMNQRQLIIGETTWGGREEQVNPDGIMDYGSLIYITLQRATTAREAIQTIVNLANTYGYPSEGESFSIADPKEAWVMDLVGKGQQKGIVWVARRVPDGYICAHANQARITRFPLDDPDNCLYAPDVISFAREQGWYEGEDADFSFRDAYNPLDFGGARACDARAWSAFNILCDGVFTYEENGQEISRPAADWLDYAMGYDLKGEMPLFVKPARKITVKDVADVMRDHFEGTPMDMTQDVGAGPFHCPYRWRPMDFEVDGKRYIHERAISTQQTGFSFVAQCRKWLPSKLGGVLWFGVDDTYSTCYCPVYCGCTQIPICFEEGNGSMSRYSETAAFWLFNRVSNFCYLRYDSMIVDVQRVQHELEDEFVGNETSYARRWAQEDNEVRLVGALNRFCNDNAEKMMRRWRELDQLLLMKYIDGNIKHLKDGKIETTPTGVVRSPQQPPYPEWFYRQIVDDKGEVLQTQ